MMSQYRQIKSQIPRDALLLFRLGDFYEMFFDDATEASKLLNLTLTHRNGVPMCGIPHHAADGYIGKLLKAGRPLLPRVSSATSGFFFCGMSDEPVV